MKNYVLILVVFVGASIAGYSQETEKKEEFKPEVGMSALEVTFDPAAIFNSSRPGSTFRLPSIGGLNQGIKVREWRGEQIVTRGTFLLGFLSNTVPTVLYDSQGDRVEAQDTYFEWALQFRPGIEYHFTGTKRLSPYFGAELILGFGSNKYTTQSLNGNDEMETSTIKNGNKKLDGNNIYWNYANGFSVGAGLLAGFDYYVAKHLFVGLEINYAFVYNKPSKIVVEQAGSEKVETKSGSNWYFNPSTGASLRLGWAF